MNKLKLNLDQLSVETFETDALQDAQRGTVRGHSHLCTFLETCPASCTDPCGTCDASCSNCGSCYYTCGNSCGGSCYDATCVTCQTNCQQESCVYVCP